MGDMTDAEILAMKEDLIEANERLLMMLGEDGIGTDDSDPEIWEDAGGRQVIFWVLATIVLIALAFTGGLNAESIGALLIP